MENIKRRILHILSENSLSVNRASRLLGLPQRTLNRQLNEDGNVSMELISALQRYFTEISIDWVMSGKGSMYKVRTPDEVALPYYDTLPVSAGVRDVVDGGREVPSGYISIPNAKADFLFPVTGTSMQPEINPGDIVGVKIIDTLQFLDSKKIYMIVTRDERMIKHCCNHPDNPELLLCTSPNYPDFTLRKEDVFSVYEVTLKICEV